MTLMVHMVVVVRGRHPYILLDKSNADFSKTARFIAASALPRISSDIDDNKDDNDLVLFDNVNYLFTPLRSHSGWTTSVPRPSTHID